MQTRVIAAVAFGMANVAWADVVVFRDRALWEATMAAGGQNVHRDMFAGVNRTNFSGRVQVDANTSVSASTSFGAFYSISPSGLSAYSDAPEFYASFDFTQPLTALGGNFGAGGMVSPTMRMTLRLQGAPNQILFVQPPLSGFWGFHNPDWRVIGLDVYVHSVGAAQPAGFGVGSVVYTIVPAPGVMAVACGAMFISTRRRRQH